MNRRHFMLGVSAVALTPLILHRLSYDAHANRDNARSDGDLQKIRRSEEEWREILTKEEFHILREEGTEPAGSSKLNDENRDGTYVCAGCELPLFKSEWKYDSRTGWPSFWDVMHEHIDTKDDRKLFVTRTEYHCARCGGHQGHVFDDGPEPTGKRWCNNGLALDFVPS